MTLQDRCNYYNYALDSNELNIIQKELNKHESSKMFKLIFYVSESYVNYNRSVIGEEIHSRLIIRDKEKFSDEYLIPEFDTYFWDMVDSYRNMLDRKIKLDKI